MAKQKSGSGSEERPRGGRARRMSEMLPDIGGTAFRRFGFRLYEGFGPTKM